MTSTRIATARPRPTSPVPEVAYGDGAVTAIPDLVRAHGWRRVLLVCGRTSFAASGAARILPALHAAATVERWSDFDPNTDAADLVQGLEIVRDLDPEAVLAVGGGSALDMAKLLCAFDDRDGEAEVVEAIRSGARIEHRGRGLVLAPTTSGTGSETTHFAVVYVGDEKFSIAGPAMYPDAAVLDPQLSLSGSAYQRATSGIDAVAQAIESLWATGATATSRRFARHALRLLLPSIEASVTDPTDETARAMCLGAHLAGRAIDISRTTAAHALSYAITKGYGVSHGHAVALTLGHFIEAHDEVDPARLQPSVDPDDHARVMAEVLRLLGARDGAHARERFVALLERLGLITTLSGVGVPDADARAGLARAVNAERLGNNPVAFGPADLEAILDEAA
jgi:alcohol dehydrogenase